MLCEDIGVMKNKNSNDKKLRTMENEKKKLGLMRQSVNRFASMSAEEIEEVIKERDEANNSANDMRNKLNRIIKEKMNYETESIAKYKNMETE